jgi:hypothetical protein
VGDQPDEDSQLHAGWRAGDQPGGPSGPGNEPLVYERYIIDWEWKNYLGCLWVPGLVMIIFVAQWLIGVGVAHITVQLIALAALFGLFLAFGLIDLSGYRWDWRRGLIWLWLPCWVGLMIIATVLHLSGVVTIAGTVALVGSFWLYSRSGKHSDG